MKLANIGSSLLYLSSVIITGLLSSCNNSDIQPPAISQENISVKPYTVLSPEIISISNFNNTLSGNIMLGINEMEAWISSKIESRDWIANNKYSICINYPKGSEWGLVTISPNTPQDLSQYKELNLEMKSLASRGKVSIELADTKSNKSEFSLDNIETNWKYYKIPLNKFYKVNFSETSKLVSFFFRGTQAQEICIRKIEYLP